MSNFADQPLKKITINIFESDYQFLIERYGSGYQLLVRKFIQEKCREMKDE
jgi:hypothetical protein